MGHQELRIGLIGAGMMGSDHADRIDRRTSGARMVTIADPDISRARETAERIEDCRAEQDPEQVIQAPDVDAIVLATPGVTHEPLLLAAIERGVPVLCEKPLTPDSKSSQRIVEAEVERGRRLVQVGFMRRFDPDYVELKHALDAGELGRVLLMHCVHRNAAAPPGFTNQMMIFDSVVHEIDTVRWLLDEEITAVSVRRPRSTSAAPDELADPQLVTIETESGIVVTVEIFVNCGFGYQVRCEAVGEKGTALAGGDSGLLTHSGGHWGGRITPDFRPRFRRAFDDEFQRWVDAARSGGIDGASAWDGYAAAAVCEAGVESQHSGDRAEPGLVERPALYA